MTLFLLHSRCSASEQVSSYGQDHLLEPDHGFKLIQCAESAGKCAECPGRPPSEPNDTYRHPNPVGVPGRALGMHDGRTLP
jgi:hypothetical protein